LELKWQPIDQAGHLEQALNLARSRDQRQHAIVTLAKLSGKQDRSQTRGVQERELT
jgi:hypothetical protein